MKQLLLLIQASLILGTVFAQKTIHDPNVQARKLPGSFTAIEVSGGIDLYLSEGSEAVAVSARNVDDRDRIVTQLKNGVLIIKYDSKAGININRTNRDLKVYVSVQKLERLKAVGGCDVAVEGKLTGDRLALAITGGSDFKGEVDITTLVVDQSGGSDVDIKGKTGTLVISASSGSDFDGYDLVSEDCTIEASSGSDVNITVNKELSAEASSGSDISWKGNGNIRKKKTSSAGSISHRS